MNFKYSLLKKKLSASPWLFFISVGNLDDFFFLKKNHQGFIGVSVPLIGFLFLKEPSHLGKSCRKVVLDGTNKKYFIEKMLIPFRDCFEFGRLEWCSDVINNSILSKECQIHLENRYFCFINVFQVFMRKKSIFSKSDELNFKYLTGVKFTKEFAKEMNKNLYLIDKRSVLVFLGEKKISLEKVFKWQTFLLFSRTNMDQNIFLEYLVEGVLKLFGGCFLKKDEKLQLGLYLFFCYRKVLKPFFKVCFYENSTVFFLNFVLPKGSVFKKIFRVVSSYFLPFMPMVVCPRPWHSQRGGGGYLANLLTAFVGSGDVTLNLSETSPFWLALNRLQKSPFLINWDLIEVWKREVEHDSYFFKNAQLLGIFSFLKNFLFVSDKIYFVWGLDGRGRFYTRGSLNPLSSKLVRHALMAGEEEEKNRKEFLLASFGKLQFESEKKVQLDLHGWFCKPSFAENVKKGKELLEKKDVKTGRIKSLDWDKLSYFLEKKEKESYYLGHLDATSSGSQMVALMDLRKSDLRFLNLEPASEETEVYSYYLYLLQRYLCVFRLKLKRFFIGWDFFSLVTLFYPFFKSLVMKQNYGLTFYSYEKEVMESLPTTLKKEQKYFFINSSWFFIKKSLEQEGSLFFFLSKYINELLLKNQVVGWDTPLGSRVVLSYFRKEKKAVFLKKGQKILASVSYYQPTGHLDYNKIRQSYMANFVHTLDSCILCLTVAKSEAANFSLLTVHDSFYASPFFLEQIRSDYLSSLYEFFSREDLVEKLFWKTEIVSKMAYEAWRKERLSSFPWKKLLRSKNALV